MNLAGAEYYYFSDVLSAMRIPFTGWPVLSMTLPLEQPVWASAASGVSGNILCQSSAMATPRLSASLAEGEGFEPSVQVLSRTTV